MKVYYYSIASILAFFTLAYPVAAYLRDLGYISYFGYSNYVGKEEYLYSLKFLISLGLSSLVLSFNVKSIPNPDRLRATRVAWKNSNVILMFVLFFNLFVVFYNYYDLILLDSVDRRSVGVYIVNQYLLFSTVFSSFVYVVDRSKKSLSLYFLLIICLLAVIPFSITSSRAVGIPFFIFSLSAFLKSKKIIGCAALVIAIHSILISLAFRDSTSFSYYWSNFFLIDISIYSIVLLNFISTSFPGFENLSLLDLESSVSFLTSLLDLVIHLNPLPTFLFNLSGGSDYSINSILNISTDSIGLNPDLLSFFAVLFGSEGAILAGVFVACTILISYKSYEFLINRFSTLEDFLLIYYWFTLVYFLFGSQIMTLRACTRYLIYMIFLSLLVKIVDIFRISFHRHHSR